METLIENNLINNYYRIIKNWNIETKKRLILKLNNSIIEDTQSKHDFSLCFGAWDDARTADDIINEIKNDRVNQIDLEEF
jgi:hypothetical protein